MAKQEAPPQTSAAVMSLPQPPARNAEEYLKAYTSYIYTAVSSIAQEVASIDLHLFKASFTNQGPQTTEIYEHEVLSLLQYMNPLTTFYDMVEATQIYLELTGEAFWVILRDNSGPKEVWLLRPDWVKVVPDPQTVIKHYTYSPGGNNSNAFIIPRENMVPFKYFHPLNPYRGRGTVQSAALPFDIMTFAQEYNRNFFFNSAIPSMLFTTEQKLSEATIKRFMNQWQASYGGRGKSNKIAFLGNGLKMDQISTAPKELDFIEQQKLMRDDVLAVFKVPKTILGLTDDVNKANADATTLAFMERVVTPRMIKFVGTLTEILLPMFTDNANLFLDFTDPSPQDTEMKLKRYESGRKLGWLSANEVRAEENMEPVEGGDDYTPVGGAPFGAPKLGEPAATPSPAGGKGLAGVLQRAFGKREVKPVGWSAKPKKFKHMMPIPQKRLEVLRREKLAKSLVAPLVKFIGDMLKTDVYNQGKVTVKEPTKKKTLFTEEQKVAYWRQFIEHTQKYEKHIHEHAVHCFKEEEQQILVKIETELKQWSLQFRKGKVNSLLPTVAEMNVIWQKVWEQTMREILIEQGDYVLDFLGTNGQFDVTSDVAVEFIHEYGAKLITGINETTREALSSTLAEGFDKGESVEELSKRVREVFTQATGFRAEMIARTESIRASNVATVEAYRQSGVVEAKEWLAERDDRTCAVCDSMDGKTIGLDANYFEAGDKVTSGGQSITVGELDVGEPPLHSNCRCTTIPVLIGE